MLPVSQDRRYLNLAGGAGALDASPGGASDCPRLSSALAEGAKQPDPAAGAPEHGDDFLADWNACSAPKLRAKSPG